MRTSRTWTRLVGGAVAALAVAAALPTEKARAKSAPLKLTDINIGDFTGVPQDAIIEMTFTESVDPATVNRATLQMRA